jgi:hypothetical protein
LSGTQPEPLSIGAVNRRGRDIRVRVTTAPLASEAAGTVGVIVLIDEETAGAG